MSVQRLDALVSRKDEKSGKTYYTRIGAAWVRDGNRGMQISVKLEALPIGGEMVLMVPMERDAGGQRSNNERSAPRAAQHMPPGDDGADGLDDIPF